MRIRLLVLVFLITHSVFSTEYFVTTKGNDKNKGRSESDAWRTISHAARKAKAGDIVWIKAGDYGNERVVFKNDGKKDKIISFIGYRTKPGDINKMYYSYKPGRNLDSTEMPLLNGGNRADGTGLKLFERSYILIKNLQVTNYRYCIDA